MRRIITSSTLETHAIKMAMFENFQPEDLLVLLKNFNISIDGTGNITISGRINYLHMILCG